MQGWVSADRPRVEARTPINQPDPALAAKYIDFAGRLAREPAAPLEGAKS